MENLKSILAAIDEKGKQVDILFDEGDKRGDGGNTRDEIARIKSLNAEIEELNKRAGELREVEVLKATRTARRAQDNQPVNVPGFEGKAAVNGAPGSLGLRFVRDGEVKSWMGQFAGRGSVDPRAVNASPAYKVGSFMPERHPHSDELKTIITGVSNTSGGAFVFNDWQPQYNDTTGYQRILTLRDIITIGETGSDTVEFARVSSVTNAAAPTAEATATGDGSGAAPESAMTTVRVSEAVKSIRHWVPVTTRALADASMLRTEIDSFLMYGLMEELEDQLVTGSGSGENFTGILNASGTTAQAYSSSILTTTRKARTKVRTTGRSRPTAWLMHPNDWEAIDLLQDGENRYHFGGPRVLGNPTLWGLPVVECEAVTEGYAICADFRLAVLWERMQAEISVSNSHSDFFIRGMVAVLGEMRAAFGLRRPAAFVIADLTA